MNRACALFVLAVSFAASAARADDDSKAAQIEEIFRLTKMENVQEQIAQQVQRMAPSFMAESGVPVEAQKIGQELAQRIADLCRRELSWEKLKPAFFQLYNETFTEEEVNGIVAFYRTPAGQALVTKSPLMMRRSNQILHDEIATLMPEINQLTRDYLEKYQKERETQEKQENSPKK